MEIRRFVIVLMLVLLSGIFTSIAIAQPKKTKQPKMSTLTPIGIERASVLPPGELALDAGLTLEFGREWMDLDYDNFRLAPLGVRYGIAPSLEIGGFLGFSKNDRDDRGAPDDSGLEGISIFGKLEMNEFAALQVGLTMAGDDDVYPYPNDGFDLFINLPLKRPMGKGLLYGEFGYTVQGGDLDDSHHFSYGIGYAHPLSNGIVFNFELSGDEEHNGTDNTLDLLMGVNFLATEGLRLAPFVAIGLNDAGPDFALGSSLEIRF